jgi:hypothetical protein
MMKVREPSSLDYLLTKLSSFCWLRPILVSVILVIPCFWQPIVSGVDLQSHLYNAWLAKLILHGDIHGLWISHQSTNIVVDIMLSWLMRYFGVSAAERIIASALVLVFLWGAFHFISAVRGSAAYWLAPWVAVLTYGFTFQMGLLNYYLSCGLVLWIFAILWRRRVGWQTLWTVPLFVLAYLAHPLPVLWLLGAAAYCWLVQKIHQRFRPFLFGGGVAVILLFRCCIAARYGTHWSHGQFKCLTGADQALLRGWAYLLVTAGFLLFSAVLLCQPENRWRALKSLPAQVYYLTVLVVIAMPSIVRTSAGGAEASLIADRVSLFSGVLLLAVLSRSNYRRGYLGAGLLTAAIFFGALFCDIRSDAIAEAKMERLVETLPAGERVIALADRADSNASGNSMAKEGTLGHLAMRILDHCCKRLNETHLISRACLGHCFDYMNYEPSTGQFRIHAAPENPVVLGEYAEFTAMKSRGYVVKARDLPLYALIKCAPEPGDMIMLPMEIGETPAMLACPGAPVRR